MVRDYVFSPQIHIPRHGFHRLTGISKGTLAISCARKRLAKRFVALRLGHLPLLVHQLAHRAQSIGQEVIYTEAAPGTVLRYTPVAIQVSVIIIRQHLRQPGG